MYSQVLAGVYFSSKKRVPFYCNVCFSNIASETNIPEQGRCKKHSDCGKLDIIGDEPVADGSPESDATLYDLLCQAFGRTSKVQIASILANVKVVFAQSRGEKVGRILSVQDVNLLCILAW
jgi:hypothetical protein